MNHLFTTALLLLTLLSAHAAIEITPLVDCLCESGGSPQQAFQLAAEGTAGPFIAFQWAGPNGYSSPEQNPTDITAAGDYTVDVTNSFGCTFQYDITIPACPAPSFSGDKTETCPGQATGSITVMAAGGTPPYTYSWSNGADTPDIYDLAEGIYYLTVEDRRGCTQTGFFKILSSSLGFTVNAATTPPTCPSSADGAIQLSIQPAGAYTVAWSNGMTGTSLSGLAAGSYTATITDTNGCSVEKTVALPAPPSMETYLVAVTPTTCPEAADGGAELSVEGNAPPYIINWSDGSSGAAVSGLPAGAYQVTITDGNGCVEEVAGFIPSGPGMAVDAAVTPMACADGPDGAISLSVSGASGPQALAYFWSGPSGEISENGPHLTGLPAGQYCATVTDGVGCSGSGCWVMEAPEVEWPYLEEVTIRASNSTSNTGSIIYSGRWVETVSGCLFFEGGNTANFTYQILQEMSQGLIELDVLARPNRELSSFSLSVEGYGFFPSPPANAVTTFTIDALTVQAMIVNNTIDQALNFQGTDMDGRPLLDLLSNNPNRSNCVYPPRLQPDCSWSPTPAVTYAPNGTDGMDRVHLLKKECISFEYSLSPEIGSIKITEISGGTGPFTLHWENLNPEATIINNGWLVVNLESGGEYCLRILDEGTGCTVSGCIKLCKPIEALYDIEIMEPCGYGPAVLNDGSICVRPNAENLRACLEAGFDSEKSQFFDETRRLFEERTVRYGRKKQRSVIKKMTFAAQRLASKQALIVDWVEGPQNQDCLENLGPGDYTFKINDLECGQFKEVTVNLEYALLSSVNLAEATAACPDADNGFLCVEVSGGRPPYTFEWENGGQEKCAWGLSFGECHRVTVTDACGQTAAACFELPMYAGLQIEQAWVSAACDGSYSGSASVTFSGGKAPYVFVWENLSTGETMTTTAPSADHLGSGSYNLAVIDACGNKVNHSFEIIEVSPPYYVEIAEVTPSCPGAANGSISTSVTPFYQLNYSWSNGGTGPNISGLEPGTYSVTVSSSDGCHSVRTASVQEIAPDIHISETTAIDNFDCNLEEGAGQINLEVEGENTPFTFQWSNGATSQDITGLQAQGYFVTITDARGCFIEQGFSVALIEPVFEIDAEVTNYCNDTPGSINLSVAGTGALEPMSYQWSNGGSGPFIDNLTAHWHYVTITNGVGCEEIMSFQIKRVVINIGEPSIRNACLGQKTGIIELNVTGFGGPFDYSWSHGEESDVVTGLGPGDYCATVSSEGCDETACYTITEEFMPPEIVLSSLDNPTITDGSGSTADGAIAIEVIAQTEGYSVFWNNEPGSEAISGLPSGLFTAFVTDANGCFNAETYELKYCIEEEVLHFPQRIADFQLSVSDVIPLSEPQSGDGSIAISATPQIIEPNVTEPGNFYYSWTGLGGFISDQEDISGLAEGEYCVTVTNGCYTHSLCQLVAYCGDVELQASIIQSAHDPYCFYPGGPDITLSPVVSNPNGEVSYFWEEQHNHILSGVAPRVSHSRWRAQPPDGLGTDDYVQLTIRDEAWCEISDGFPIRSETGEDWDWKYFDLSRAEELIAYNYFQSYITAHPNYAFQNVNPFIGACKGVVYCNGQEIDFSQNTTLGCLNGVSEIGCASNIAGMLVKCPLGPTGDELYENVELVTLIDVEIPVGNQGKCKKIRYVLFAGEGGNPFVFSQELDGVFECDPNTDFDNDGDVGEEDGCPTVFNPGQYDCDQDGIPDACDPEPHEDYRLVPLAETCQLEIYCESGGQPIGLVDAPTYDFISVNNSEEECEKQFFCSLNNEFLYSIPGTEYCKTTISDGCIVKTYCSFLDDESPGISPEAVLATDTHYGVDCADIQEVTEHCAQAVFRPSSHQTNEDDPIAGSMKIIPNPNRGKFHIEVWEEKETTVNVEIVSITGAVLWRGGWNLVDGVNKKEFGQEMGLKFPAGIYSVAIHGANGEARYNRFVISN